MGLVSQALEQLMDQTRLADARLAGQEDDLAIAVLGLFKPIEQKV
jgi:hypothetical protein